MPYRVCDMAMRTGTSGLLVQDDLCILYIAPASRQSDRLRPALDPGPYQASDGRLFVHVVVFYFFRAIPAMMNIAIAPAQTPHASVVNLTMLVNVSVIFMNSSFIDWSPFGFAVAVWHSFW